MFALFSVVFSLGFLLLRLLQQNSAQHTKLDISCICLELFFKAYVSLCVCVFVSASVSVSVACIAIVLKGFVSEREREMTRHEQQKGKGTMVTSVFTSLDVRRAAAPENSVKRRQQQWWRRRLRP